MEVRFSFYENKKKSTGKYNLSENSILLILGGKKIVYCKDWYYELSKGDCIIMNKNSYIMTEFILEDNFQSLIINFDDAFFDYFVKKNNLIISKFNNIHHFSADNYIENFVHSIRMIENDTKNENLTFIKIEELMTYIHIHFPSILSHFYNLYSLTKSHTFSNEIKINSGFYNLKISEIAFLNHMSVSTFKRTFKKQYEISPKKYFLIQKMSLANQMIQQGISIKEIADKLGYANISSFSRAFKNFYGYHPSSIRMI
ncbi:helix-turn-helix transcriptional regulator [Chryseobacterium arthrosphaerae]|uniref:helix-turn-helix domain-containing protein n=1 Tax=Chryseobacterium arthrosphaerae TaxID=651561 RepID=UPI0023E33891|nr:response regulator transcription factor [Chryseobacterium arthrosphaerae]WES96539.1 helix-turn-helix transcriptional regulator [Chryseobacterium arthrosphaerae]